MNTYLIFTTCCLLGAATKHVYGENEEYIFTVDVNCGRDGHEDAVVRVATDVGLTPELFCSGEAGHLMSDMDGVHFTLPVSYPGRGRSPCVFQRAENGLYNVKLSLEGADKLPADSIKEYRVFCNVTSDGVNGRAALLQIPSSQPTSTTENPVEDETTMTELKPFEQGDITLDMRIMNVLKQDITGKELRDKKLIWLTLKRPDVPGLTQLKPLSCDIISNETVAFLRGGCGTDDPWSLGPHEGLQTLGLNVTSPYFRLSTNKDTAVLNFRCSFRRCSGHCDGNSCQNRRRKRTLDTDIFRTEESLPFHVPHESKRSVLERRLGAFLRERHLPRDQA